MGTAWNMPIAVIGKPTGDGRQFDAGALTHRDLPLPFRYVAEDSGGHANAVIVGHIAAIGKEKDGTLPASGEFYDDDEWPEDVRNAATAARMFVGKKVIGPSVDLDQQEVEHVPEPKAYAAWKKEQVGKLKAAKLAHAKTSGGDCGCGDTPTFAEEAYDGPRLKMIRAGRMASATLVHIPAFAELSGHAKLTPIDSSDPNVAGTTSSAMIENDEELTDEQVFADAKASGLSDYEAREEVTLAVANRKKRNPKAVQVDQDDEEFAKRRLPSKTKDGEPELQGTDGEQGQGGTGYATDPDKIENDNGKAREKMAALMAAAAPAAPPKEWFDDPKLTGPTPLHIGDDGRVYGHAATWGTCHVGIGNSCTMAPKSQTSYAYFHTGEVVTADGSRLPVGRLTYGAGGHAGPNLGYRAAVEHYDSSTSLGALVRAGEDQYGIWVAGALVPEADDAAVRTMRATPLSGDWRRIGGNLEMVAALHVNTAGFPIPRLITASVITGMPEDDEELLSLVAAGVLPVFTDEPETATAGLDTEELGRAIARGMLAEQAETATRDALAAEWRQLVASATTDNLGADYDEAMSGLLVALVQE